MKKRILSVLMAILMLSSSVLLAACSDSNVNKDEETEVAGGNTPSTDSAEPVNTEELSELEQRQLIPDDLPEADYNGDEFRVVTNDADQYEQEIWVEESNGEACNDAVFNRNARISDRFNVKFFCERNSAPNNLPKTMATAGTMDYHVVGLYDYQSYYPINAQAVLNWLDTPHVDLSKPWHNKLANDDATVNGYLYTICSDLAITSMTYTHAFFTNLPMAADFGYAASDLYGLVKEGKWTIDLFSTMIESMYVDANGNGKSDIANDRYGFAYQVTNPADVWFNAFGGHYTGRAEDGSVTVDFMGDKTVAELETLLKLHYENPGYAKLTTQYDEEKWFLDQKTVFAPMRFYAAFSKLREMDAAYTMLPYPKWDEEQQEYYTNADDKFTVFCLPTPSYGAIEFIGVIFEALCAESYKTVFPVYYDVALKGKYSTDADTADMVELIMAGRLFDFSFQFGETVFQRIPYMFRDCINDNNPNIASKFKGIQKAMNKQIEKTFNKVYHIGE